MSCMEYVLHPRSEIDARIERLRSLMDGLTGVLIIESIDMGYFSGTCQDGLVYIPRDGPSLVMVRRSLERAREESPLEVAPLGGLRGLGSHLGVPSGSTIGLEMDVLPCNLYARIVRALGDVRTVDVSERIRQVRSVKSEFEIGLIREASRIVDSGIASVSDHLKEGMREIELAGMVEAHMRSMGHQGMARFRRFNQTIPMGHLMAGQSAAVPSCVSSPTGGRGPSIFHPQGPGFRRISRHEPILADFAGVYNGYISDETRIFSLGRIDPALEEAHQAALEIEDAISEALLPGRTGGEIYELSERMGAILGYQDHLGGPPGRKCGFVGHGLGLEIDEHPVLGPLDHIIQPGMTVAVEPKMIFPEAGVVGVEDTFLIHTDRAESLTRLPREIWQV